MTIYTLYLKIHQKTGLRYLGQTSKDPVKYHGSGTDWKSHIKQFGNNVVTKILIQTTDKNERNEWGRYYSKLWRITTAVDDFGYKIWANRIPETGGGGCTDSEIIRKAMTRPEVIKKRAETDSRTEVKSRRSAAMIEVGRRPEVKEKRSKATRDYYHNENTSNKAKERIDKMKKTISLEKTIKSISDSVKKSWKNEESRTKRTGKNAYNYDHTIYTFIHISGIVEKCTREELRSKYNLDRPNLHYLIKGRYKHHRGWRIIKN